MDFYGFERGRGELPGGKFGLFMAGWDTFILHVPDVAQQKEQILQNLLVDEKAQKKQLVFNAKELNKLVKEDEKFKGNLNNATADEIQAWANKLTSASAEDDPSKSAKVDKYKGYVLHDDKGLKEIQKAKASSNIKESYEVASKYGKAPKAPDKAKESKSGEPDKPSKDDDDEPVTKGDLEKLLRSQSGGDDDYRNENSSKNPIIKGYEAIEDMSNAHARAATAFGGAGLATNFAGNAWGGGGGSYSGPGVGVGIASGGGDGFGFGGFGQGGGYGFGEVGGGYGGGFGAGGDLYFDVGGFGVTNSITQETEGDNRKLKALIDFLILKIMAGDIDAITTAIIVMSRKAKETTRRAAVAMLSAMKQYDERQDQMTKQFEKLEFDPENPYTFQRDSQALSMRINGIAMARQMFMNHLRDVMSMSEEIGNVESSITNLEFARRRSQSRFTA